MAHAINSLVARNMPICQRFTIEAKNFARKKRKLLLISGQDYAIVFRYSFTPGTQRTFVDREGTSSRPLLVKRRGEITNYTENQRNSCSSHEPYCDPALRYRPMLFWAASFRET